MSKYTTIGGQGVMDGIMMRNPENHKSALAVRKASGEIELKVWYTKPNTSVWYKIPVIRGVLSFVNMMTQGVGVLTESAKLAGAPEEECEPSKFEKKVAEKTGKSAEDVMMGFAVVLALVMAVGLFFVLPSLLSGLLSGVVKSKFLLNLIDGLIRITIFMTYIIAISFMKEIKTVYRYHGAEHKTIACYEAGQPLDTAHVQPQKRLHPRCGTSYLLLVMILSTVLYSILPGTDSWILRLVIKLAMLPLIAGVSYEALKLLAKGENFLVKALRWPGMQLQRLTTAEPDEAMMQVAILAFESALGEKSDAEIEDMRRSFANGAAAARQRREERIRLAHEQMLNEEVDVVADAAEKLMRRIQAVIASEASAEQLEDEQE